MNEKFTETIVVTGATGFLGRHLMPALRASFPGSTVIGVSSKDYDLTDPASVERFVSDTRPAVLYHLAALVGGIQANKERPADFFHANILMTALVIRAAARFGVGKLIYTMGACGYPADASSPISEDQMWSGYAHDDSAGYSMAKKMGIVACRAYRSQYGLKSVVLVPGNMYGEYDNFRENESHVIPGLIRRYHEARLSGAAEVTAWGTGAPVRDFVYAGDVAAVLARFADDFDCAEPVNVSTGAATSIREVTELVASLTGFEGHTTWDASKPNGRMASILDVSRLRSMGLSCDTPLEAGLAKTIEWFATHYAGRTDGIRL